MRSDFATIDTVARTALARGLSPPPRLSLSEWADENFRLSAEAAASAGRWSTLPYQRGIMDAITDRTVTRVSLMKSARIGYTLMVSATVGYYVHQAPCSILVVQPTVEDAEGYSNETIAPMLRDVPVLSAIMKRASQGSVGRKVKQKILHKRYPGGVLSMVGANSGAGFRRVSRKVVVFDEVDAYPPSAGSDGDPIRLGTKRSEFFWDRKIISGSTPLVSGHSRIETLFEEGDKRRFYVPCPHCGHFDYFVFSERESGGHWLHWEKDHPESAHFVCSKNGCVIEEVSKRDMIALGEWRGEKPFEGHASFHIWAAYSYSPNATWADLAREFLQANVEGREALRVFANTTLGETFKESGEAPDFERLYSQRERYPVGTVPEGVKFLTCGVDVQKDRAVYEVVGWGVGKESWSVDAGVLPFDTADQAQWSVMDELQARTYPTAAGASMPIAKMVVDSGYNTQQVYTWCRRKDSRRVMAVKGNSSARAILGVPSDVDIDSNGRTIRRGAKVWLAGVDVVKSELYGFLKLPQPKDGEAVKPGYCHFPEYDVSFFRELTAEHLVSIKHKRTGFSTFEWQKLPGRENHHLDARVYARVGACALGLDKSRLGNAAPVALAAAPGPTISGVTFAPPRAPPPPPRPKRPPFSGNPFVKKRGRWI